MAFGAAVGAACVLVLATVSSSSATALDDYVSAPDAHYNWFNTNTTVK